MAGEHPSGLPCLAGGSVDLSVSPAAVRAGRATKEDQGDCGDAGALRLSAHPRAPEARRLGGECQTGLSAIPRNGPATAQQDAETAGQGQASFGPHDGQLSERYLGDGLRARPVVRRHEDSGAHHRRYADASVAGHRRPSELSWKRCRRDA